MFVRAIELTDFRNYERLYAEFSPELNVLVGANAQGKTNLLEAVYLVSVGRSPRTAHDKELIRWGRQRATVRVASVANAGHESVDIILDRTEKKRIAVNKLPITRMGELMGVIPTSFFSPGEIKVVQSSPGERRSFMDIAICQMSRAYFYTLQRYNEILAQRNRLLKSGRAESDTLDVWDIQLASTGAKIVKSRKGFIGRLMPHVEKNHDFLTSAKEKITLEYEGADGDSALDIEKTILKELQKMRRRDLETGFTHTGPQKDDLAIRVNDVDVRAYGSQGQLRTSALSLKLANMDLFRVESGTSPVLLLDDVLSELDKTRQIRLIKRIEGIQTILTCTDMDTAVFKGVYNLKTFKIEGGKVRN